MKLGRKINGLVSTRQLTKSRHTTWLIAVTVTILVAWSAHAPLDELAVLVALEPKAEQGDVAHALVGRPLLHVRAAKLAE